MSDQRDTGAAPQPTQPSASCCAPEELATCCESPKAAGCCEDEPASGGCGCQ